MEGGASGKNEGDKIAEEDTVRHGGWWKAKSYEQMTGTVCIEFSMGMYVRALDNGLFTLGAPHGEGIQYQYILYIIYIFFFTSSS